MTVGYGYERSPTKSLDLNSHFIREYLSQTSDREIMGTLDKTQMAKSLGLLDKNDPAEKKIKNFAVLDKRYV